MTRRNGQARDVIAFGGSAGSIEALLNLFGRLPARLPALIAVAVHRSPVGPSQLAAVLQRPAKLPVLEPHPGDVLDIGHIYLAPRDLHLVVDRGVARLVRGPKEHFTRPAIDPLFRSLAASYGARVVGILLSGANADGVAGLMAIKAAGGLTFAQDPEEAGHPTMPRRAIVEDDVDRVMPLLEIAAVLPELAAGRGLASR